jgi:hypothetical protein
MTDALTGEGATLTICVDGMEMCTTPHSFSAFSGSNTEQRTTGPSPEAFARSPRYKQRRLLDKMTYPPGSPLHDIGAFTVTLQASDSEFVEHLRWLQKRAKKCDFTINHARGAKRFSAFVRTIKGRGETVDVTLIISGDVEFEP